MMPEHHPADDPGHLDIDAVSAFVDRDLDSADLTTVEIHLTQCPACHREVLEIRTTVLLLGALPQYEPRRSFCLGHEHARAVRRRANPRPETPWLPSYASSGPGPSGAALQAGATSNAGWLPGLHVAALVVGALLLLVTVGDLTGFVPDETAPMQLAAPTALAESPPPPQAAMPAQAPELPESAADQPVIDGAQAPAPAEFETAFQQEPSLTGGTERVDSASEEMLADQDLASTAPRLIPTAVAAAAVTQAIPTAATESAPAGNGAVSQAADAAPTAATEQPSRMRIVQIALGLLLAWLIVTIAGLRWVRRLR